MHFLSLIYTVRNFPPKTILFFANDKVAWYFNIKLNFSDTKNKVIELIPENQSLRGVLKNFEKFLKILKHFSDGCFQNLVAPMNKYLLETYLGPCQTFMMDLIREDSH